MISWPLWVRVSYRFLPFTVFSLGLPFCFQSYIVHLQCMSEGVVSMFNKTSHSFFAWGSLWASVALPCCCHCWVGCIVYMDYMYPAFVLLLADITRLLFLFRKCCCCFLFSPSFSPCVFSFLSLVYWPFHTRLLACLIRAAFCIFLVVCICLHPNALSSVVLISVLLYESAAFVFVDGSQVSEGLV